MDAPYRGRSSPVWTLRAAPRWSWGPDRAEVRLWDDEAKMDQRLARHAGVILEGILAGEGFDALVTSLEPYFPGSSTRSREMTTRRFLYSLHRLGIIDLTFPAPPVFAARYEVVKELGRGGVGIAYLCRDRKQGGREVVVKRAWDFFLPMDRTEAMMRREALVMQAFDHRGIARMFGSFEEDGRFFLVREFVQGSDLSALRGRGEPDAARRRLVAREWADVLAHMHDRGYLALDQRPANFFLEPAQGLPRLIDVGHCVAMDSDGLARLERKHGSPGYVAPEIQEGRVADARTDVWGFGRFHFFLTTGQPPKEGDDAAALDARLDRAGASAWDRRIVQLCAADDAAARPADMRAVARLLDEAA